MKKFLALLMVIALCISLCACGSTSSTQETLTDEELKFVGTWTAANDDGFSILRLYDDGVALSCAASDKNSMDGTNSYYGTWDIRENHIIVYHCSMGSDLYSAYEIDGEFLNYNGKTYKHI